MDYPLFAVVSFIIYDSFLILTFQLSNNVEPKYDGTVR